jgi:hypothetical protein
VCFILCFALLCFYVSLHYVLPALQFNCACLIFMNMYVLQRSTKHTYKTKYRVTRTPLKTGGELRCSGRVGSSCSTSGTRRVNLVTNPIISNCVLCFITLCITCFALLCFYVSLHYVLPALQFICACLIFMNMYVLLVAVCKCIVCFYVIFIY